MLIKTDCPLLGFSAYSGTGKTTLLSKILPILKSQGIRVAVLKHAHHNFDVDHPGKDSHTLRHAGASQMLIASSKRWALMVETPEMTKDPTLNELLAHLDQSQLDIILVEGFKDEPFSKIELHRPSLGKPFLHTDDKNIIALATDEKIQPEHDILLLDINDINQITDFIMNYMQLNTDNVKQLNSKYTL
ncbi:MAG: molybdopterin-guanine dinucleotide biosynthesis protein B [Gammaproteobacteria bacterium]|nr:molybdopterin-guanine dinucleotide biosynthesis protein B [Gammaproteobacteria bacterium]